MSNSETTIAIKKSTRDLLNTCKFYYRETYDDLVVRLANFYLENNPNGKNIRNCNKKAQGKKK